MHHKSIRYLHLNYKNYKKMSCYIIYSKLLQFSNIKNIKWTDEVLKFDKFKDVNDEQSLNIESINLTDEVLKFDKSKDVNDEQRSNINVISSTKEVLKLDKFNEVNNEQ